MRRSIFLLILGILCAALLCSAISVYLFHDVDHDMTGRLNDAFSQLCVEFILFAVLVGGGAGLLAFLGSFLFHLRGYSPRPAFSYVLGIGATVVQYPWDFLGRVLFPKLADASLAVYLVVAMFLCAAFLLGDSFKQKKAFEIARDSRFV
jgi:hypothetical protein